MTDYCLSHSHPRYQSLRYRDLLSLGVKEGITSLQGLTAHGRGEAFDYLLGEKTHLFARKAVEAGASQLLLSSHPVLSVNGNSAVLAGKEFVMLSKILGIPLEINLFHYSVIRAKKIAAFLRKLGAANVLLPDGAEIPEIASSRRLVSSRGQKRADTVFVPLEDGDRTERLIFLGKKVITIDLNPLSRTARKATVTIVDNIVRAMPLLLETVRSYKDKSGKWLMEKYDSYDNRKALKDALTTINKNLTALSQKKRYNRDK